MPESYRSLLAAVRASYTSEKAADERRSEIIAHCVYRPLSFYVTPLFLRAGIPADGVTLGMFVFAAAMPALAAWGPAPAWVWVVAIGMTLQVLDCVDGNIARVSQRFSKVGGMLDGLCTLLFWALFFFSAGILAQRAGGAWVAQHGREIGLGLAVLLLGQREMEDTFDHVLGERVRTEPTLPASVGFDLRQQAKAAEQLLAFGGLAITGMLGRLDWFLGGLAVYQVTVFTLWLPRFVRAVWRRRG